MEGRWLGSGEADALRRVSAAEHTSFCVVHAPGLCLAQHVPN